MGHTTFTLILTTENYNIEKVRKQLADAAYDLNAIYNIDERKATQKEIEEYYSFFNGLLEETD